MIKNVLGAIALSLCVIFNRSLFEGIFPDIWKLSNLVPLFENGEKAMPSNYPPVALLGHFGEVLERIIFKHIYNHLYSNNLLFKYQSGFRPGHYATFQLIYIFSSYLSVI